MASRKRQLLDVLRAQHRAQHSEVPLHAPAEAPRPIAATTVAKPRSLSNRPSWLPLALRWGFGLLWLGLIFWLISLLWPDANGQKPGSLVQGAPVVTPEPPPKPVPASSKPPPAATPATSYGILAITYQGTANEQQATSTALALRDLLQPQPVQVRRHIDEGKTWYEVFIGQAAAKADLKSLLEQVRSTALPAQPGQKPFHDAYITRIPNTTS